MHITSLCFPGTGNYLQIRRAVTVVGVTIQEIFHIVPSMIDIIDYFETGYSLPAKIGRQRPDSMKGGERSFRMIELKSQKDRTNRNLHLDKTV
jgi:hypothetical protein